MGGSDGRHRPGSQNGTLNVAVDRFLLAGPVLLAGREVDAVAKYRPERPAPGHRSVGLEIYQPVGALRQRRFCALRRRRCIALRRRRSWSIPLDFATGRSDAGLRGRRGRRGGGHGLRGEQEKKRDHGDSVLKDRQQGEQFNMKSADHRAWGSRALGSGARGLLEAGADHTGMGTAIDGSGRGNRSDPSGKAARAAALRPFACSPSCAGRSCARQSSRMFAVTSRFQDGTSVRPSSSAGKARQLRPAGRIAALFPRQSEAPGIEPRQQPDQQLSLGTRRSATRSPPDRLARSGR